MHSREPGLLLRLARKRLDATLGFEDDFRELHGADATKSGGEVCVRLRRNGRVRGTGTAAHPDLASAVDLAARAALGDRRHRPLTADERDSIVVELWVQTGSAALLPDRDEIDHTFRIGIDGVSLAVRGREGSYRPSVPITASIPSAAALLTRLCRKLGLPDEAWTSCDAVLRRTSWTHFVESPARPEGYLPLERLRPLESVAVSRDVVGSAVRRCVRHMLAIQRSDGSLGYEYDPLRDRWSSGESRVRAAGCAYALARASGHELTAGLPGLHDGASAVISHLRGLLVEAEPGPFVAEADPQRAWGKLGATALLLLALEQQPDDPGLSSGADALRRSIRAQQRPDGSFLCRFADDAGKDSEQDYFPGEALLALARSAVHAPCRRTREVIDRAFPIYRDRFRATPSTAFVPWQSEAWALVASRLDEPGTPATPPLDEVASFVFAQLDWLLQVQRGSDESTPAHFRGGFNLSRTPSISSASYLEAILHGLDLADRRGQSARVRRYRAAALACLRFVLGLQIPAECGFLFPRPEHMVGAAAGTPLTFNFRCDYDQHFLTSLLTAYDSAALWRNG